MKTCTVCLQEKSLEFFYNYKNSKDGKMYRCKECDNKAREKYKENNREKSLESQRRRNLKHKYGISLEEYNSLLEQQDFCCAVCQAKDNNFVSGSSTVFNFAVDHCHTTGKVRGLLCNQCNRAIGMLGDTPERLYKAYSYLKETH